VNSSLKLAEKRDFSASFNETSIQLTEDRSSPGARRIHPSERSRAAPYCQACQKHALAATKGIIFALDKLGLRVKFCQPTLKVDENNYE
jgi:hypothetical protein